MPFGLVGAGRVSGSFIAQLPNLRTELGPVAAQSYRLASRIANSLRAGRPVKAYHDLNDLALILICAPPATVPAIGAVLLDELDCRGKVFLLCESGCDSSALTPLQAAGAATGSIDPIPGFANRRFVVEGDPKAVRGAKRLAKEMGGRVDEMLSGKADAYIAGLTFATSLFTPLLEAAVQSFSLAGIRKTSATRIAEVLSQKTLRAYLHAGKRSWAGPLAREDRDRVLRVLDLLVRSKPLLARQYREAAVLALEQFGGDPVLHAALRTPGTSLPLHCPNPSAPGPNPVHPA